MPVCLAARAVTHVLHERPLSSPTTYFNTKRKRSGHLFQGRYKAILVEKDSYCKELSRYIDLNPIRAGLADKPSEYRWSSYPYYIRKEKRPAWLTTESVLGYFGKDESSSQKNYRKFVEDALESETKNPLKDVFASTFLGSSEFITWAKEKFVGSKNVDTRNIPVLRELVEKPSLEQIERTVESIIGKKHALCRKFCIYASHQYGGFALREIGAYYGMRGSAVSQCSRRFKHKVLEDKKLKKAMAEIGRKTGLVEC